MKIIKTEGVVIKKTDFGEGDRIIQVVSKNMGNISIFLKGIRKSKKREKIASDIINYSEFIVYHKENSDLYMCSAVELKNPFFNIKSDMTKIQTAYYVARFLDFYLKEGDKNLKLYRSCIKIFEYINKENNKSRIFVSVLYLLLMIIKEEGIMFLINDGLIFNIAESVIEETVLGLEYIKLTEKQKKTIYFLNKVDIQAIYELKLKENEILTTISIFEKYIEYHLNINIKIKNFLKEAI